MYIDGELKYEYCVSLAPTQGAGRFMQASESMSALLEEFFVTLDMPWMRAAMQTYWTHAYALHTLPLLAREFEEGRPSEEFRVEQIETTTLPDALFTRPEGLSYRAVLDFGGR